MSGFRKPRASSRGIQKAAVLQLRRKLGRAEVDGTMGRLTLGGRELQVVGEERFQKRGGGGHWGQGLQEKQELNNLFEFSEVWASSQSHRAVSLNGK